jgi:hypothetical protein
MKKVLAIFVLVFAVGCASHYQPVYVTSDGGYYIAETAPASSYYAGTGVWWETGFYPWWSAAYGYGYGYRPYPFYYYSPYFYPHHFSVWYPAWHSYYYGWGGGWHPPYRRGRHGQSLHPHGHGDAANQTPEPVLPPPYAGSAPVYPRPGKTIDEKAYWQRPSERATAGRTAVEPARPAPSAGRASRSTSAIRYAAPRSDAPSRSRSSSRSHASRASTSIRGAKETARRPSVNDEQ